VRFVIYNTEVFEFSDPEKAKEVWETFRESMEAAGGSDIHVYRNVDNPNQVLATMWWDTAEHCRAWGAEHTDEVMQAMGDITTSGEPEYLWEEY
jgi:heme-degrading monooxygenase HmoA